MDLLPLIEFKQDARSTLYYNNYRYKVKFKLYGVGRSYYCYTIGEYVQTVERLNRQGWFHPGEFEKIDYGEIEKFLVLKSKYYKSYDSKIRLVAERDNKVKIYTNDRDIVEEILGLRFEETEVSEAVLSLDSGVKLFKNPPKHKYRVYLKAKKVDREFKQRFLEFLNQYQDIKPSNGLTGWLMYNNIMPFYPWRDVWIAGHHYLEFDEPGMHTVLMLYFGNSVLGKHFELQQIK
jgi:hypothetical protein